MTENVIASSRALWNRSEFDLNSDEVLAQLLDRGEVAVWQALYRLARTDQQLRARIKSIVLTVPLPLPHFWLAALASLGESVDFEANLPDYYSTSSV
jgi:hypothetical protein